MDPCQQQVASQGRLETIHNKKGKKVGERDDLLGPSQRPTR